MVKTEPRPLRSDRRKNFRQKVRLATALQTVMTRSCQEMCTTLLKHARHLGDPSVLP